MPDGYYRNAAARSDFEQTVYLHEHLIHQLQAIAPTRKENLPTVDDIRTAFRVPMKKYTPMILLSNDVFRHTTSSNQFELNYGGDIEAQKWLEVPISAGTMALTSTTDKVSFNFARHLAACIINKLIYKVSSDTVVEITGDAFFVYTQLFVTKDMAPGVARMTKELVFELDYAGEGYTNAGGTAAQQLQDARSLSEMVAILPHLPVNAFTRVREAFSIIIPLDLIVGSYSLEESFVISAIHQQPRYLEFTLNPVANFMNTLVETSGAVTTTIAAHSYTPAGTIAGDQGSEAFTGTAASLTHAATAAVVTQDAYLYYQAPAANFTAVPTIGSGSSAPVLYVNFILVHRDLQRILTMNAHAYVIHRTDTVSSVIASAGSGSKTFQLVKAIESIALITSHTYSKVKTQTYTGATPDTVTVDGVSCAAVHRLDPYSLPTGENPFTGISIVGRGNKFYENLSYDFFSCVVPHIMRGPSSTSYVNRCLAVIPFTQKLSITDFWGSYNSGHGPDAEIQWQSTVFSPTDNGSMVAVIFSGNVMAMYRGMFVVRYP